MVIQMLDNEPAQTILVILAALAYAAVASGCVIRTLFEGYATRAPWDAWRVLGLLICFVWPLLFLAPLAHFAIGGKPRERVERPHFVARQDLGRKGGDRLRSNG